jgi:hypothetical protein
MNSLFSHGGRRTPGDSLRHPLVMGMLFVWIVNDHVLKGVYGNAWTGKLSDIAGLVVFPLIPLAIYQVICAWTHRVPRHQKRVLGLSLMGTALLLISINLSESLSIACCNALALAQWPLRGIVSGLAGDGLAPIVPLVATVDPTDLLTLPALLIPWFLERRVLKAPPEIAGFPG